MTSGSAEGPSHWALGGFTLLPDFFSWFAFGFFSPFGMGSGIHSLLCWAWPDSTFLPVFISLLCISFVVLGGDFTVLLFSAFGFTQPASDDLRGNSSVMIILFIRMKYTPKVS